MSVPYVSLDVETYSEAGYYFDVKWRSVAGGQKGGLPAVGAAVYAEHPSTEVLMACYQFGPGADIHTWAPGYGQPDALLEHVASGGLVHAWNSMFEWLIWEHVCRRLYGWPELPLLNTRDSMAVAQAFGLPGKLANAAFALGLAQQKDKGGMGLIRRFSVPKQPTKNNKALRHYIGNDHENAYRFYAYCAQDVRTEAAIAEACPPLSDYELEVWKLDQEINARGMAVDQVALQNCRRLVAGVSERLTEELKYLTNGRITSPGQVSEIPTMLGEYGIAIPDLQADTVKAVLANKEHIVHRHPWAVRVLEIRRDLASASVKKLEALNRRLCADGRVRGLLQYCGAERTGRWAGRGPQPQNLPRGNAKVVKCSECGAWQGPGPQCCMCMGPVEKRKWNFDCAVQALESFEGCDVDGAIRRWGDVLAVIAGCLRSLFVAAPGKRLICSDYSAIEAVVLAALAGEEWRLEVFRTHGRIYEMSASKITGTPLETYLEYKRTHGEHHPDRQKIGKVAELASGYQGWVGAWKNFGADEHMSEEEIKRNVIRWREESPAIVAFWRGLEHASIEAVERPGSYAKYREITYHYDGQVLRCYLPSGRALVYHQPRIVMAERHGRRVKQVWFWGYNSNHNYGPIGWIEQKTYGGRLTENIVQAASRDLMAHGLLILKAAGYHVVLHVHDEAICEEKEGLGSVEEVERLMGDLPPWAEGWPVKAKGGWIGRAYRKD